MVIDSLVFVKVEEAKLIHLSLMDLTNRDGREGRAHTASFISSRCSSVMLLKGAEGPAL